MNAPLDLTKEPPRSPRERVCGYDILGRTLDKCRALLFGDIGSYQFDCPLDKMLFEFLGVSADEFKLQVESGATDEQIVIWTQQGGRGKTDEELAQWNASMEAIHPFQNPERRESFIEQCAALHLDPAATSLFEWLEADDRILPVPEFK